jgi:hypothetical protein
LAAVPACGDRAPRASEASASAALNASGDHFLLASFYRMTYTFEALGADGVLTGEGAYLPEATVYARASVKVDDIVEQEALYRPPDLYPYGAEDGWTVISPWNQGWRRTKTSDCRSLNRHSATEIRAKPVVGASRSRRRYRRAGGAIQRLDRPAGHTPDRRRGS